jgi:hypothetical protein
MDALLGALAGRTMLMRDREGRPLGEHKAGAERMQGIATELRTCPYRGSRYHHALPMNVSALRQVTAHWAEVLGGLAYLRDLHHAWAGPATVRLIDVWRVGHLTSCIADFAFARTWNAYGDGELPAPVGALYKVSLGIASTCFRAWLDRAAAFERETTTAFLMEFAEAHGQLIGQDQVCGGSPAMIREMLEIALQGDAGRYPRALATSIVVDEVRFRRFVHATAALKFLRYAFERQDAAMRWDLGLGDELGAGSVLSSFAVADDATRLAILDELFAAVSDPRCDGAALQPLVARIRGRWSLRRVTEVPAAIARYLELEAEHAALAGLLKQRVAESLGIDLAEPLARERGLVRFVPIREGRPSLRSALLSTNQSSSLMLTAVHARTMLSSNSGDAREK